MYDSGVAAIECPNAAYVEYHEACKRVVACILANYAETATAAGATDVDLGTLVTDLMVGAKELAVMHGGLVDGSHVCIKDEGKR